MREALRRASPTQIQRRAACMIRARKLEALAARPDLLRAATAGETPLSDAEVQFAVAQGLIRPPVLQGVQ